MMPTLTARLRTRWTPRLLFAVAVLAATLPAKANTYLFSFTGAELKTALQTADGVTNYNKAAYFGIFVQPSSYDISAQPTTFLTNGYSYGTVSTPNPGSPYEWSTDVITDPSNPDLGYGGGDCTANCSWAGFYKPVDATSVAVVSGATVSWIGATWWSFTSTPTGWGFTEGTILGLIPDSAVYSFLVSSSTPLSGSYLIQGRAAKLESSNPTDPSTQKKEESIGFTLDLTPSEVTVPEPATYVLSGGALILLAAFRRKFPRSRAK